MSGSDIPLDLGPSLSTLSKRLFKLSKRLFKLSKRLLKLSKTFRTSLHMLLAVPRGEREASASAVLAGALPRTLHHLLR
eukprot:3146934-Rhodomonas_salina.1